MLANKLELFNEEIRTLKGPEDLLVRIRDILEDMNILYDNNPQMYEQACKEYDIFDCDSLREYINDKTDNKKELKRTVMQRSKNKIHRCQNCGSDVVMINGVITCSNCSTNNNVIRTGGKVSDNHKHIEKQLNGLIGKKRVNKRVMGVLPYLKDWLLHRYLLYDWLMYRNKLKIWNDKYSNVAGDVITDSYFENDIPAEPSCAITVLYIYEFHEMISYCEYLYMQESNVDSLELRLQLRLVQEYAKTKDRPDLFEYEGGI